jgi:TetR/AcrR family transcriptional regulator, fatty acid metabolism regulator protein
MARSAIKTDTRAAVIPRNSVGQWGAREAGILSVARQLYDARGYERVSMADVARASGLSEGTLYYYFHDKTDLVLSVSLAALESNVEEAGQIAASAKSLESGLCDLIAYQLRSMLAAPEMYRIWLREVKAAEGYGNSRARASLRQFSGQFIAFLKRWPGTVKARPALDPAMMRDMLYGGIEQIGWTAIIQGKTRSLSIDVIAAELARAYMAAFDIQPAQTPESRPPHLVDGQSRTRAKPAKSPHRK